MDLDMLTSDFYVLTTTSNKGSKYDDFFSQSHGKFNSATPDDYAKNPSQSGRVVSILSLIALLRQTLSCYQLSTPNILLHLRTVDHPNSQLKL
jgi:hypothetical protein